MKGQKAKVTRGKGSEEFSAASLERGINLAAEFLDNPFSEPFLGVEAQIARQQAMEVGLVKNLLHDIPEFERMLPSERDPLERIAKSLLQKDLEARQASAAAVRPVRHVLVIEE